MPPLPPPGRMYPVADPDAGHHPRDENQPGQYRVQGRIVGRIIDVEKVVLSEDVVSCNECPQMLILPYDEGHQHGSDRQTVEDPLVDWVSAIESVGLGSKLFHVREEIWKYQKGSEEPPSLSD